jgi:transcriptional regulator GlxA family with amidase domain
MLNVGFLLCDSMLATSITLPMEMLLAAESAAQHHHKTQRPQIKITTYAIEQGPVKTQTGLSLIPDKLINDSNQIDLLYLPGLWRNPRPTIRKNWEVIEWLKSLHQNGTLISAVGTSVCYLAEAGLLNGKVATTHWYYFDQFQKHYPTVQLKRQYFITQANTLYCAASVNSLADLTVHFIGRFFSTQIAQHVEKHFSHEIRKSYDKSAYFDSLQKPHPDEVIIQIQHWLDSNYHRNIQFSTLANQFDLSTRSLNRRFKNALDQTPNEYLQKIRISTAKDLLQNTNLAINEIADKVGCSDPSQFTCLFKKHLNSTPLSYRKTVRAKLFQREVN